MKFTYSTILIIFTLCFISCGSTSSQQIISNDKAYEVKGSTIFKNGEDITETLTIKERQDILNDLDNKLKTEKRAELVQEKAEKALRKAEQAQKKAEKELRKKQNAQDDFEKYSKKLADAKEKYERLKRKGSLSPNQKEDWLKKIENLKEDVEKYKKRM